ncbi:phosphate ABC transporter substrate-binding protein PstS [Actinoplanes sp. CA-142083]|uniref:phosphate ABC transporter substrate-binding protein PstS n=1 Tax=Actinoplanes sp. CA-142083 TaxID=3239903 RepID=UPI003D925F4A
MRVRGMIAAVLCGVLIFGDSPAFAASAPVSGAGSTFAENAILQWTADVQSTGLHVNYAGTGTLNGQEQFRAKLVDFAVVDFPYETPPARPFEYVPLVAQDASFIYHLTVGGNRVTSLRLSGETLAGIFTGAITAWNDPAIREDNPGLALPSTRVIPVVRSDANGTSAMFTGWLAERYRDRWNTFCPGCGSRTVFPNPDGEFVGQAGASAVVGVVAQIEGTITYTPFSYAFVAHQPTAKVRNVAGYFTAPTAAAIGIGLREGGSSDPRAYPLVSYTSMVVPTSDITAEEGRTLTQFAAHGVCEGQRIAPLLGYGVLPPDLSRLALERLGKVPGADVPDPFMCADVAAAIIGSAPYPSNCDVCEQITTTVQPGALFLSVEPGDVVLPTPVLTPDGEKLVTSGDIRTLTVADLRAGNPGWSVSAQATDFIDLTGAASQHIAAAHLGWTPSVVEQMPVQRVTAGPRVTGLDQPATLAQAAAGYSNGTARLGAHLTLDVPTTTLPGTYTTTLTFTVI